MSKETDLLSRLVHWCWQIGTIPIVLQEEIQKVLEQPNQEPVAWRGINFTQAEGDWLYRDFDEPFTDSNFNNVGEALYLAPQTRKPLSFGEIVEGSGLGKKTFGYTCGFEDGVKWAEFMHGIGEANGSV